MVTVVWELSMRVPAWGLVIYTSFADLPTASESPERVTDSTRIPALASWSRAASSLMPARSGISTAVET